MHCTDVLLVYQAFHMYIIVYIQLHVVRKVRHRIFHDALRAIIGTRRYTGIRFTDTCKLPTDLFVISLEYQDSSTYHRIFIKAIVLS